MRPLSSYNRVFYFIIVKLRRLNRRLKWWLGKQNFAKIILKNSLEHRVYRHEFVLIRSEDSNADFQHNKVENLKIAIEKLDGILIRPGETFSFCYLVGCATKRKGYREARTLSDGKVVAGIGGGLCKMSILLHWLCLHSPLTVTECHHHSFEPFPDDEGVVPSGYGPTVFYNYLDYQCLNNTDHTFQFRFWIENKRLIGEVRVDKALSYRYHVFETNDRFLKIGEAFYRHKEIWRHKYLGAAHEEIIETELIQKHKALIKYVPEEYERG